MVTNQNQRTERLFEETTQLSRELPNISSQDFELLLHVNAPFLITLSPESQEEVELYDLLKWCEYHHGLSPEIISAISYILFFKLIGVDGLIHPATPEQWMQIGRDVKSLLKK